MMDSGGIAYLLLVRASEFKLLLFGKSFFWRRRTETAHCVRDTVFTGLFYDDLQIEQHIYIIDIRYYDQMTLPVL